MSNPDTTGRSSGDGTPPSRSSAGFGRRATAISDRHLSKLAIVYVRQSSTQRILVIDEDQGRSGRTVEQRPGFQRLLAEVTLDHVGIVLGLEISRLSRSSK